MPTIRRRAGPSRKVDGSKYRPPAVTGVTFSNSPASGNTYGYGEQIEAAVAVSHRVLVTTTGGTPTLALTIGAHTRQATLTRAGRRNRLTFSYTVQSADLAPAGASIAVNALSLNGGKITHDADTATHAVLARGAVAVDTTRKVNGQQGRPPKVQALNGATCYLHLGDVGWWVDEPSVRPLAGGTHWQRWRRKQARTYATRLLLLSAERGQVSPSRFCWC